MIGTICLSISFFALSVIVCILNKRLDLCMERLREISEGKAERFEYDCLKNDVDSLMFLKRNYGYVVDYLILKDKARIEKSRRERECKECKECSFEIKVDINPKYNPKKQKQNGK